MHTLTLHPSKAQHLHLKRWFRSYQLYLSWARKSHAKYLQELPDADSQSQLPLSAEMWLARMHKHCELSANTSKCEILQAPSLIIRKQFARNLERQFSDAGTELNYTVLHFQLRSYEPLVSAWKSCGQLVLPGVGVVAFECESCPPNRLPVPVIFQLQEHAGTGALSYTMQLESTAR